jgi:hypothetical protein
MARKIGTGITAREYTPLSDEKLQRRARSWTNSTKKRGGIFGAVSARAVAISEHIRDSSMNVGADLMTDSPEHFARRILKMHRAAQDYIQEGNADLAGRWAWEAGVLWATAKMKWEWEKRALAGKGSHGGSKSGGENTKKELNLPIRKRRMAMMEELVPRIGVTNAAQHCAIDLYDIERAEKKERDELARKVSKVTSETRKQRDEGIAKLAKAIYVQYFTEQRRKE